MDSSKLLVSEPSSPSLVRLLAFAMATIAVLGCAFSLVHYVGKEDVQKVSYLCIVVYAVQLLAEDFLNMDSPKLLVYDKPKKLSSPSLVQVALRLLGLALVTAVVLGLAFTLVHYLEEVLLETMCYLVIIIYGVSHTAKKIVNFVAGEE